MVYSPRCWVYRSRRRGLQVVGFYVDISSTGVGFTAREMRGLQVEAAGFTGHCVLCRIFRHGAKFTAPEALGRGLQIEAAGFTGRCVLCCIFEHGAWVYSPRCGVYRSRRRGLQVVRFYVAWVSSTGQGLQPEVRVYRLQAAGFTGHCFYVDLQARSMVCSHEVRVYSREVRVYRSRGRRVHTLSS